MAKSPDCKEGELPCKIPFIISNKDPWVKGGILRPKDWTAQPYIGKDGRDYLTWEALQEANRRWSEPFLSQKYPEKIIIQNLFKQILEPKPEKR